MQFKTLSLSALALFFVPASLAVTVSYDMTYDNPAFDLGVTACSDGPNGLQTKGFTNLGSLPQFPNVGGAAAIAAWNSPNCGSCWQLTYNGKSINVLAVDHTDDGFNLSLEALNTLTDGQGEFLGRIDAQATQVAASQCGL
ncbi:immunomodulatory protein [Trametes polyzona]|nr:immunomodulatory protein [Trametes polyzona]